MADPYSPVRVRGFGDPGLNQGFGNLAKMFAPPSIQDQYASTKAAEVRQKMGGIAELYRLAGDPATSGAILDRWGAVTNTWSPTSGFVARDMHDATTRRGQDIKDATDRYGIGVASSDRRYGINVQSGDTRRGQDLDDATKRRGQDINSQTHITTTLLSPVQKDAIRYVPPDIASLYKVDPMQPGVVAAQPGEKNYMPDGRVLEGGKKPLTESEVKGQIIQGLTDAEKRAIGFGNTPVEVTRDPASGKPMPMTRPQMLDTGAVPVPDKNAQVFNYRTPQGSAGTAVFDPTANGLVDSQTRQPLPQGAQVQAPSGVQNKEGLGPTTANQTEANRIEAGLNVFESTLTAYKDLLKTNPAIMGIPGTIRGTAQNAVSVLQEFGQAFGNLAPEARVTADQAQAIAQRIGVNSRDPAIAQARIFQADIAYKWAQMQNPTGEVSRQAFERALEAISGGSLPNNASALEAVDALQQTLQRERQRVSSLRQPGAMPPGPPNAPGVQTIQTPSGPVTIRPRQ